MSPFGIVGSIGPGASGRRGSCCIGASTGRVVSDTELRKANELGRVVDCDTAPSAAHIPGGSDSQFHSSIAAAMSGLA